MRKSRKYTRVGIMVELNGDPVTTFPWSPSFLLSPWSCYHLPLVSLFPLVTLVLLPPSLGLPLSSCHLGPVTTFPWSLSFLLSPWSCYHLPLVSSFLLFCYHLPLVPLFPLVTLVLLPPSLGLPLCSCHLGPVTTFPWSPLSSCSVTTFPWSPSFLLSPWSCYHLPLVSLFPLVTLVLLPPSLGLPLVTLILALCYLSSYQV